MSELRAIRIEKSIWRTIIRPTEQKNKVMYITGGGTAPECLKKIVELSGMTPVDGFHGSAPEEELAMVIVRLWRNITLWYLSTEKNSNSKRYAGR